MRKLLATALAALALAGCAKDASQISAAYISPITYQSFTCPQLREEAQRVSARAAEASGLQDQKATGDRIAVGVGLIVFWPALLLTKGNDENTAELARLKGSMDALEQTSIQKNCGIKFERPPEPVVITPTVAY